MSNLVLYRALGSPSARSVMMLCELIGVQLQFKDVNILQREHMTSEFKKLNPMCTVPVFQDDNFVVSESHAIMKYLLSMYGGEKSEALYPSDIRTRAIVDQCMFFNAGVFFKALANIASSTIKGGLVGPTMDQIQDVESAYSVIDAYLEDRAYIATGHLTIADLAAGSTASAMQVIHKIEPDEFPHTDDWITRLQNEYVFKTVMEPGVAYFSRVLHKYWKLNKIQNEK